MKVGDRVRRNVEVRRDLARSLRLLNQFVGFIHHCKIVAKEQGNIDVVSMFDEDVREIEALFNKYPEMLPKE